MGKVRRKTVLGGDLLRMFMRVEMCHYPHVGRLPRIIILSVIFTILYT